MGAHVHSIYRISPTDARNLYVFVFAIPPWEDEYDWIEEKFVTISKALGVEGLLVMGEPGKLEPELAEAYGDLDDSIRHLPSLRSSGLIVSNVNPHAVHSEESDDRGRVFFIPIRSKEDPDTLSKIVSIIVEAAKSGDLSKIENLSKMLSSSDEKSILRIMAGSALLQPNVAGLGYDFGKLMTLLADRRKKRKERL